MEKELQNSMNAEQQAEVTVTAKSRGQRFLNHPATRIFLFYLLFVSIVFAITFSFRLFHFSPQHHPVVAALVNGIGVAGSALLAFWIMVRFADHRPWATAGFDHRSLLPQMSVGFGIGAGLLSLSVGLLWALGSYHVIGHGSAGFLWLPLVSFLGVGIIEELCFRGYLFQTLEMRWGSGVALVCTSLLFGYTHLLNPVPGTTLLERLTGPTFICLEGGLPLGAAYLLTRRWWISIGIHWAWDFFEDPVYGLQDSGTTAPRTLLHSHLTGSFLSTGGPFGPEASWVVLLLGTLLGIVLLRAAIQRGQWRPRPRPQMVASTV